MKSDILTNHLKLNLEQDWVKKLQLFKNCFIALDIFRDSFSQFNFILKENKVLTEEARSIKKRLGLINHIRNNISGHLEEKLLEKAVQWEPSIFSEETRNNEAVQLFFIYKALLESAINSYVDEETTQKTFQSEIDLVYPPNQILFFNYVGNLNEDSIHFINEIKNILNEKIKYWNRKEMLEMAVRAGKTNFNLTK